jgi:hypothetical protein
VTPPVDPTVVGIPYLNRDALDLLSNCCTSKESDLWLSLGPNWTETIDAKLLKGSRLPSSFQPIFSDGWAPLISELELIGLVAPAADTEGHYCSGGGKRQTAIDVDQLLPDDSTTRSAHHLEQTIKNEPNPPLAIQSLSYNNGIPLSSSSSSSAAAPTNKLKGTRRTSPNGAPPDSRYADAWQALYRRQNYLTERAQTIVEPTHSADPYHVHELQPVPSIHCNHNHQQHPHRAARHSSTSSSNEKPNRSSCAKHSIAQGGVGGGVDGPRRNFDYISSKYKPSPMLDDSFRDIHLNGGYTGHSHTNPSDDYTELQECHYLAGPSVCPDEKHFAHASPPQLNPAGDQQRRKGSKSAHNRRYRAEPRYDDPGHDLMVHEAEREAMLIDLGPAQTEWFYELKLRGALIVRVLFTREANNDKELTVKRGEILEVLDDTRKWWKARNIDLQVAYVPHTIVAVIERYQTLDELLTGSSSDMMMMINENEAAGMNPRRYGAHREPQVGEGEFPDHYYDFGEERRNSKTAKGAFRYF